MSDSRPFSGPQFRAYEAAEQEAVRTTIVGGRPPGSGQPVGPIPRGVEVLLKKASVDTRFRRLLLERRAAAADEIGLRLDPAEALMLTAAPAAQLEAIIDRTTVPQEHRRAFLGKAAAAMLAVVSGMAPGAAAAGMKGFFKGGFQGKGFGAAGGARADFPEPPPDEPARAPSIEARVRDILAELLQRDPPSIGRETNLKDDLHVTAEQLSSIGKALEGEFQVSIAPETLRQCETVADLIDYVEVPQAIRQTIMDTLAKRLDLPERDLLPHRALKDDLKATVAQLAVVRRDLARQLRVHLDWDTFRRQETVGDLVGMVAGAVRLRQQNAERPDPPPTRGIQPDMPGGTFGIQPDMPPQRIPSQRVPNGGLWPKQPPPGGFGGVRP